MTYKCPKGHESIDSDYCSECGARIGQSTIIKAEPVREAVPDNSSASSAGSQEICPDCGTPRTGNARFCEVCRHDFQENKTGVAEAIVASQKASQSTPDPATNAQPEVKPVSSTTQPADTETHKDSISAKASKTAVKEEFELSQKLNVIISVDRDKASSSEVETDIKPDTVDRVFPLDLDENLVGRRSSGKGIYPEIEINDPGVSRRHLKFIKQSDGSFSVLELGSANGTELNGAILEPGVNTAVKAGDELTIGIWTRLKLVSR